MSERSVELDIKARARVEQTANGQVLVLSDGKTEVRIAVPSASDQEPLPYQAVYALGIRIEKLADTVKLNTMAQPWRHGPLNGP